MAVTAQFFCPDALTPGDGVVLSTQSNGVGIVKKAVAAALADAGIVHGVASQASNAGGAAVIVTADQIGPTLTGLAVGAAGNVRINPATARCERIAGAYSVGDYPVGFVNAQGVLQVKPAIQVPVLSGQSPADKGANLTDADATVTWSLTTAWRVLPAATLTANRTVTLGTSGASAGALLTITRDDVTPYTLAVVNGGPAAGTLFTLAGEVKSAATFYFDGTNWAFRAGSALVAGESAPEAVANLAALDALNATNFADGTEVQLLTKDCPFTLNKTSTATTGD